MTTLQEVVQHSGPGNRGDNWVTLRKIPVRGIRLVANCSSGGDDHRSGKGQGEHQLFRRIHVLTVSMLGIVIPTRS